MVLSFLLPSRFSSSFFLLLALVSISQSRISAEELKQQKKAFSMRSKREQIDSNPLDLPSLESHVPSKNIHLTVTSAPEGETSNSALQTAENDLQIAMQSSSLALSRTKNTVSMIYTNVTHTYARQILSLRFSRLRYVCHRHSAKRFGFMDRAVIDELLTRVGAARDADQIRHVIDRSEISSTTSDHYITAKDMEMFLFKDIYIRVYAALRAFAIERIYGLLERSFGPPFVDYRQLDMTPNNDIFYVGSNILIWLFK
ncbi:hypothetical protein V1511DRAFT_488757 [Dipodascopsis uninucleata]